MAPFCKYTKEVKIMIEEQDCEHCGEPVSLGERVRCHGLHDECLQELCEE